MAERSQHSNILLAFISLTAVIVIVSLIGFFTLGKGPGGLCRAGRGRDLSVRPVGHRPGDLPSGQRLVHRPAAQVLNRSDTKGAFIFHKRLTSCAICIIIKPSSVCSEKRAEQTRGSLFPFVCSALFCSRYANEHAVTGRRSGGFYAGCSNHRLRCRWRGCRL